MSNGPNLSHSVSHVRPLHYKPKTSSRHKLSALPTQSELNTTTDQRNHDSVKSNLIDLSQSQSSLLTKSPTQQSRYSYEIAYMTRQYHLVRNRNKNEDSI